MPPWQRVALFALVAGLSAALVLLQGETLIAWTLVLALPIFCTAVIRIVAVWQLIRRERAPLAMPSKPELDERLPTFSVLVPLHRETLVIPDLVAALHGLDYPSDRLEVLFITEAEDRSTYLALLLAGLASNMQVVVVPPGAPQTKPRALNYALQVARGTLVAIFDAEDQPAPDQLRVAAAAFVDGGPKLACVQARLAINNASASFWTRQFANEYAALFAGLLPSLHCLGLPLPLGGTSNHFRRDVLLKCGGWDPFNVTEDADLGIRLARLGYDVSVIDSVTMEEAPARWRIWLGQRTRWQKGWIQTYLVHMRRPARLLRDLGAWRFAGFQIVIGGMIASTLVHPWFYIWGAWHLWESHIVAPASDAVFAICAVNLACGYGAAMLLALTAAIKAGPAVRATSLLWVPVYWLAISFASYRAMIDLIFRPFYWEKTQHNGRKRTGRARQQAARDAGRLRAGRRWRKSNA